MIGQDQADLSFKDFFEKVWKSKDFYSG